MTFKHEKGMSGYYVYALVDPRDNRVFYIGKGEGNRVFQHAKDTGKSVHCYILRHNLTEKDAESTLSEFLGDKGSNMDKLVTKIVSRPDQWNHPWDEGIKTTNVNIYGCPKIELTEGENLMLVSLNYSYYQKLGPAPFDITSIYESTRKYWVLDIERARKVDYVLGVCRDIVRCVYKPFSWEKCNNFKPIRYAFEGAFVLDSQYLTKDVSDYPFILKNPIKYISGGGWDNVNWGKKTIIAPAEAVAPPSAAARFDLSELQEDVASGKKEIVVSAGTWDWNLPAIVDHIKGAHGITLDLSKTKITNIGTAFKDCKALKAIILPEGLASIKDRAFFGCHSLTKIDIASGNKNYSSVDGVLFSEDKKTLVCFPEGKAASYYEIPQGVTTIGNWAFCWCPLLAQVTIPKSVTSIGKYAFHWCKALTQVVIPGGVTSIEDHAFHKCTSLTDITISSGVTSIGYAAFAWCDALAQVTIPSSVTSIEDSAFKGCNNLSPASITFDDESGWYFDKDFAWLAGADDLAISLKNSKALYKKQPATGVKLDLSELQEDVASGKKEIVVSAGTWDWNLPAIVDHIKGAHGITLDLSKTKIIKTIVKEAFKSCDALKTIILPERLTSIEDGAFRECSRLEQITIPESVTNIGDEAFWGCGSLAQITIPNGVMNIGNRAFWRCAKLADKDGFVIVRGILFDYTGDARSVVIPEGVTSIGAGAFSWCSTLVQVTIPEGVTSIGDEAFWGCGSLAQITIPNGVMKIGDRAFRECSILTQVAIPASVTNIGREAFSWCESLKQIMIPGSVTSIGKGAFNECTSLTQITFADTSGWYFDEDFTWFADAAVLAISLKNSKALYKKQPAAWAVALPAAPSSAQTKLDLSELQENVASGKKTIVVPAEAKDSDLPAIAGCIKDGQGIELDLSETKIKTISNEAFKSCDALKAIILPKGLTRIGDWAFLGCEALAQVTIPNSVMSIGGWAFYRCDSLSPASITFADTSGWYFDKGFAQHAEADALVRRLAGGSSLYKKAALSSASSNKEARKTAVHKVEIIDSAECDVSVVESDARVSGSKDSLTASQQAALASLNSGGKFFLTGSAGTGKSYLIKKFIAQQRKADKNVLVAASTGIAAQNIGGATAHRAFNIPARPLEPKDCRKAFPPKTVAKADVIVIDEVSMLRFDVCEFILGMIGKCSNNPTVVFVGDFWQLPPVITTEDEKLLCKLWHLDKTEGGFAFQAQAWKDAGIKTLELKEVVRQKDKGFSRALEKARREDWSGVEWIIAHRAKTAHKGAVGLYATNEAAGYVNERALAALKGPIFVKEAEFYGEATADDFNGDVIFKCKVGARVISLVNAPNGSYANGSMGTVTKIDRGNEEITVDFDRMGKTVIAPYVWSIKDYEVKAGKLLERERGSIRQMPLKLAYALTIHKSQGQSFDQVNLDPYCFDEGHLYVALSRCQSVDGLYFTAPPKREYLMSSQQVRAFYEGNNANADVETKGWTAFMKAATYKNADEIKVLLAEGADVNARTEYGWTALMAAARYNANAEVTKALLATGADVNAGNGIGWTVLMHAAFDNANAEVTRALLAAGADVNARERIGNGWTALMKAAYHNKNPDVVKVLIEAGADKNARDEDGNRAIDCLESRKDINKFYDTDAYWKMRDLLE